MKPRQGSVIPGNLWDIPVPYELSANLSLNSRGVILRAFEQFRLKSCIDFKPRAAEEFYISVEYRDGCWSSIGRTSSGGQTLSIGKDCGRKAIVEHEFLHALGFSHQHTRYDRDDYVTINYGNITKGYESSLSKSSENVSITQGTSYDYYSVMHFDKNAFSNGKGPTIITKSPEFQDVIGQLMEMSESDVTELNKLYKCNSSVSFLDHCSFDDESLCQMSVCSAADYGWKRVNSVKGINVTDHTYLGRKQNGSSLFMHFSTEGRNQGDAARLESKTLTPTRDCKVQCLQFYYYHSGNESDQLNIWIREYQNEADSTGTLRLMDQITETPGNYWKLRHVPLNANQSFQVVFEGRKGAGNSSGGFSLDDINVSETECPFIWQIRDVEKILNRGSGNFMSPLYYSSDGYRFRALLLVDGNELNMYVTLVSGVNDDQLQWPCPWRQITVQILDQNPHIQKRMSFEQSITTDPNVTRSAAGYYWDNPRKTGVPAIVGGESVFLGGSAIFKLLPKADRTRREFIKGGDFIILITTQDISGLLQNDSLPCPKATVKNFNISTDTSAQQGPCAVRVLPTTTPISTTTATPTTAAPTTAMTSTAATPGPTEGALPTPPPNSTTTATPTTAATTTAMTSTAATPGPTEGALPTPQPNSTTTATPTTAATTTAMTSTAATPGPTEGALPTPPPNSTTTATPTTAATTTAMTSTAATPGPTEGALPPQNSTTTTTPTTAATTIAPTIPTTTEATTTTMTSTAATPGPTKGALPPQNSTTTAKTSTRATPGPTKG
ncbi:meprin A subunit beta-like [Pseudorasbora parva]|uniref:meprin A subunit beta-like n=1 Tax=Pseudorasbora parva TaxID=51549 RepID=UPI00351EAABB